MIGISFDFAHVKGCRCDEVRQVVRADFHHQIRISHLAPEFCFHQITLERAGHLPERVHH